MPVGACSQMLCVSTDLPPVHIESSSILFMVSLCCPCCFVWVKCIPDSFRGTSVFVLSEERNRSPCCWIGLIRSEPKPELSTFLLLWCLARLCVGLCLLSDCLVCIKGFALYFLNSSENSTWGRNEGCLRKPSAEFYKRLERASDPLEQLLQTVLGNWAYGDPHF